MLTLGQSLVHKKNIRVEKKLVNLKHWENNGISHFRHTLNDKCELRQNESKNGENWRTYFCCYCKDSISHFFIDCKSF